MPYCLPNQGSICIEFPYIRSIRLLFFKSSLFVCILLNHLLKHIITEELNEEASVKSVKTEFSVRTKLNVYH